MPTTSQLLQVVALINRHLASGRAVALSRLSAQSGWSKAHLHRALKVVLGETPKRYVLRRQLEDAAESLMKHGRSRAGTIVELAHELGFSSHEVFTRAFVRHFGTTPSDYRCTFASDSAVPDSPNGACLRLYRMSMEPTMTKNTPTISLQTIEPQPILAITRRVALSDLPTALGECLPAVFTHCQRNGIAMAGPPFSRYSEMGVGAVTVQAGIPVAAAAASEDNILADTLPGGRVVTAVHIGPYDKLPMTHAAMERWLGEQGLRAAGSPWESYLTDPGEVPDPSQWQTLVFYPVD